jgi:hypothetical protein
VSHSFGATETDLHNSQALLWVELILCIGFVAFRTYVQYQHNKRLFSNDYVIIFALFCHVGSAITSQLMIPPMYELEALKSVLATGGIPPANAQERALLYLKYQFAVLITFWTTCMSHPSRCLSHLTSA